MERVIYMTTTKSPKMFKNSLEKLWMQLVQLGFSLLYNQLAWTYDAVSWLVSFGAWRNWQLSALPYIRGHQVLEIAHGPGHILLALDKAGFQVTGIDISKQMNKIAWRRIANAGKSIPVLCSSAQELPFSQETFDSIIATFPTEFIFDPKTLSAIYKSLKMDGLFIIVLGAELIGQGYLVKIIELLYRITGQRSGHARDKDDLHPHKFSQYLNLQEIFYDYGFELEIDSITLQNSIVTILSARKI